MAENYKLLYEQMKKIVTTYQDEVVPCLREIIKDREKNQIKVRCKDCKHFDRLFKGEGVVNKIGTCHLRDDEGIETAQSCDDFCSYGERKDDGNEA